MSEQRIQDRLERLKNRMTRYEIIVRVDGEPDRLVGYTVRPSGHGQLELVRSMPAVGHAILSLATTDKIARKPGYRWPEWHLDDGRIRIMASGRTQREAIISGELPSLVEVAS